MRHLIIKNLGPISEADIELKRINVIIGRLGKSCVLKVACYCTWIEKRIELAQNSEHFETSDNFINELVSFHKLQGYVKENTYIEYESDFMFFSFNQADTKFSFRWKSERWKYKLQKVTYIPAERNMVAAIPNWFDVKLSEDNIRSFISDWEIARKAINTNKIEILNLGVKYYYDSSFGKDKVIVEDGIEIDFTGTSSGLQSLIPMFVHLYYLNKLQYVHKENKSITKDYENNQLLKTIYTKLFEGKVKSISNNSEKLDNIILVKSGNISFIFTNDKDASEFKAISHQYLSVNHCDIFLEEPEANLFPPTQSTLTNWLIEITKGDHPSNIFIATHSPYILTSFLEKEDEDMGLFFIIPNEKGENIVKVASKDDIQQMYDYGIDAFFNIESF